MREINAGNPNRARSAHLARSGSQSEHKVHFILPTGAASDVVKSVTTKCNSFFITECDKCNYKVRQVLLQSATDIAKCDNCCKIATKQPFKHLFHDPMKLNNLTFGHTIQESIVF